MVINIRSQEDETGKWKGVVIKQSLLGVFPKLFVESLLNIPILADIRRAKVSAPIPSNHHTNAWNPSFSLKLDWEVTCFADIKVQINIPTDTRAMEVYLNILYLFFKMIIPRIMLAIREPDLNIICRGMAMLRFRA